MKGYGKYVALNAAAAALTALEASMGMLQPTMRPWCYAIFGALVVGANVALKLLAAKRPTDSQEAR